MSYLLPVYGSRLWFLTYPYIWQSSGLFGRVTRPRKYGYSRWNFVIYLYIYIYIYIYIYNYHSNTPLVVYGMVLILCWYHVVSIGLSGRRTKLNAVRRSCRRTTATVDTRYAPFRPTSSSTTSKATRRSLRSPKPNCVLAFHKSTVSRSFIVQGVVKNWTSFFGHSSVVSTLKMVLIYYGWWKIGRDVGFLCILALCMLALWWWMYGIATLWIWRSRIRIRVSDSNWHQVCR